MTQLIHSLLHARVQLWIWHTQTSSYATHKALANAYEDIEQFTDTLTESLMADEDISLAGSIEAFEDASDNISAQISAAAKLLKGLEQQLNTEFGAESPADIVNLRDELVLKLRHARYMLTLS